MLIQTPQTQPLQKFLTQLTNTTPNPQYTVEQTQHSQSSGGDSFHPTTCTIKNNQIISCNNYKIPTLTQKQLQTYIRNKHYLNPNIHPKGITQSREKTCYYGDDWIICFNQNNIINYIETDGRPNYKWNIKGHNLTLKRSTIINSTKNLTSCLTDADCTLTTLGVCKTLNQTNCQTSINKKYEFIWGQVPKYYKYIWGPIPIIEDQCIEGKCANQKYKATCIENKCEATIIS